MSAPVDVARLRAVCDAAMSEPWIATKDIAAMLDEIERLREELTAERELHAEDARIASVVKKLAAARKASEG